MYLRSEAKKTIVSEDVQDSLLSSFLSGLLITLADQKAILFCLGFLSAIIDLDKLNWIDTGIIILIASLAISTKLVYAYLADQGSQIFENSKIQKAINILAGSVLFVVGVFLLANN